MPASATASVKTDGYTTTNVETKSEGWTAKISKTEVDSKGCPETVSGFVNVGSISNLLTTRDLKDEG